MQNVPLNENPHCPLLDVLLLIERGIKPTLILLTGPAVQGAWMETSGRGPTASCQGRPSQWRQPAHGDRPCQNQARAMGLG